MTDVTALEARGDAAGDPRAALRRLQAGLDALSDFAGPDSHAVLLEAVRLASGATSASVHESGSATSADSSALRLPLRRPSGSRAVLELVGASPAAAELDLVRFCATLLAAQVHAAASTAAVRRDLRHRQAVNAVVGAAYAHGEVDDVLAVAVEALRSGMLCQGVMIRAFDVPDSPSMRRYAAAHPPESLEIVDDHVLEVSGRAARICWDRQTASLLHIDHPDIEPLTTAAERDEMFAIMRFLGTREMLMAPLGSGSVCQGWITLTRTEEHAPFDDEDVEVVLAIGREIGGVIRQARDNARQQELIDRLTRLSDHKSRFTATLAHQLKNPLTSIQGHVEMVRDAIEDAMEDAIEDAGEVDGQVAVAALEGSIDVIDRGARRMAHIAGSMLELSRLEQPQRPLEGADVALDEVVRAVAELSAGIAEAGGVRLDTGSVEPVVVCGAADELDMVVDNLVSNAVKYSSRGSTVRLGVRPARDADGEDWAVLWCQDEGIGMTAEDVGHVFDAFHRADDARQRQISGTGLGMAIVSRAVERHGGHVQVASELGTGTRVEVWLPVAGPSAP